MAMVPILVQGEEENVVGESRGAGGWTGAA